MVEIEQGWMSYFLCSVFYWEDYNCKTPYDSKFSDDEKQEALTWRYTLLRQFKSYNHNNFNPSKVNVIDPTKDNFTRPLSVKNF